MRVALVAALMLAGLDGAGAQPAPGSVDMDPQRTEQRYRTCLRNEAARLDDGISDAELKGAGAYTECRELSIKYLIATDPVVLGQPADSVAVEEEDRRRRSFEIKYATDIVLELRAKRAR